MITPTNPPTKNKVIEEEEYSPSKDVPKCVKSPQPTAGNNLYFIVNKFYFPVKF